MPAASPQPQVWRTESDKAAWLARNCRRCGHSPDCPALRLLSEPQPIDLLYSRVKLALDEYLAETLGYDPWVGDDWQCKGFRESEECRRAVGEEVAI